jgi:HSP20 family protein
MNIMAIRGLIPWSRQENRLPTSFDTDREADSFPLLSLHRDVNRLFDDVFRGLGTSRSGAFDRGFAWPNVEFTETEKEFRVTAELPGLDEKDVELSIEEGVLTLRGEKKAEVEDKERGYSERSYGRFERRIALPRSVERNQADATFRNGVLTVTLPKSPAANENRRRIPINGKTAA